jgi:hypothetical protein
MIKNKEWKFLGQKRIMGKMSMRNSVKREKTIRAKGVKFYKFLYVGK